MNCLAGRRSPGTEGLAGPGFGLVRCCHCHQYDPCTTQRPFSALRSPLCGCGRRGRAIQQVKGRRKSGAGRGSHVGDQEGASRCHEERATGRRMGVNGRWAMEGVRNRVVVSGEQEVKVKEDCATAIHTCHLQSCYSSHVADRAIYAFSPHGYVQWEPIFFYFFPDARLRTMPMWLILYKCYKSLASPRMPMESTPLSIP